MTKAHGLSRLEKIVLQGFGRMDAAIEGAIKEYGRAPQIAPKNGLLTFKPAYDVAFSFRNGHGKRVFEITDTELRHGLYFQYPKGMSGRKVQ